MGRRVTSASVVVFAGLAGIASATDWQDMGTDKGGHSVLLDRSSLVREGDLVWGWTAQTLPEPMVIKDMMILSFRMLIAFDCNKRLALVKTSVAYSEANG